MPTCTELLIQLAATRRERQVAAEAVLASQGDVIGLEKDQKRLADAKARLQQIDTQLAAQESAFEQQGCFAIQPQRILDIGFDTPRDVTDVDALYAQTVAFGGPNATVCA